MALRSVGSGADQIATGATGGRPTGIPEKGHIRYNTKNGHFEGYSPKDQKWRLLDYVPEPETLDDYIVDSNRTESAGLIICQNFISKGGTTLTVGTQNLVIYCFGDATISGTINANSKGALGASSASSEVINNSSGLGQGGSGGFTASNSYAAVLNLTGSGGGRSGGANVRAGAGGAGGGGIAIKAVGNIENKGNISANGASGGSASGSGTVGGSGGGSGGVVVLDAGGDCTNTGQINVRGGNGGAGKSGNGGGGGGGGIVILQAAGKSRQNGTVNRQGGSGSYTSGGHTGAAGGSCGGKGGTQKQSGGMGVFSKFGSPFSI